MDVKIEWCIPECFDGERIDKALSTYLKDQCSRTLIQKSIRQQHLCINGIIVESLGYRVKAGDVCIFYLEHPTEMHLTPNFERKVSILYEDEDLLVVDKPESIPVHLGNGIVPGNTLVEAVLAHTALSIAGGQERPGVVHRLDQDTSGIILFAKSDAAYWGLTRLFAQRLIHKTYHALVWGIPRLKSGEIHVSIGRSRRDRTQMCVSHQGRDALTRWEILETYEKSHQTLLACYPLTGRTHQIRVHLKHIGHGIVGDPKYGKIPDKRLFLHAKTIEFVHPITQKQCCFTAPWPASFESKIEALRQKEK